MAVGSEYEPLVEDIDAPITAGPYKEGPRQRRDVAVTCIYVVTLLLCVVGGIYALAHSEYDFDTLVKVDSLGPSGCPVPASAGRHLLSDSDEPAAGGGKEDPEVSPYLASMAVLFVIVSVCAPFAVGVLYLWLFRTHPRSMVFGCVWFNIGILVLITVALIPTILGGIIMGVITGFCIWAIRRRQEQLDLCARLFQVSARGLNENKALIGVCLCLLATGVAIQVPLVAGLGISATNGSIAPNSAVAQIRHNSTSGEDYCVAPAKDIPGYNWQIVPCCTYQVRSWVPFYMLLTLAGIMWTSYTAQQMKLFVVAGTLTQWYFSPANSPTKGYTRRSLSHAVGPSFGSITFAGAVLAVVNWLREVARRQRAGGGAGAAVMWVFALFARCLLSMLGFLTKLTTVHMSITGEAFIPAARSAFDLMRRNGLDSWGVWWIPGLVVNGVAFLVSLAWGGAVFGVASASLILAGSNGIYWALGLSIFAFYCSWVILVFLGSVLLDSVDSVFMCYLLDKDSGAVTHQEVHEVLDKVVGKVIEQPGGALAYAAPAAAAADNRQMREIEAGAHVAPSVQSAAPLVTPQEAPASQSKV